MAYIDKYGVEFSDDRKTLVRCPQTHQGKYVIPLGTTYVADSAFSNCTQLTTVIIPDSVTKLGWYAFYNCSKLVSINFPDSIATIGRHTFTGCESLESPVYNAQLFAYMPPSFAGTYSIPLGITKIACHAFYECKKMTAISIPNNVTFIGDEAFTHCDNLATVFLDANFNTEHTFSDSGLFAEQVITISLGRTVTDLREVFSSLKSLSSFEVSPDNGEYCSCDGVLFNKDQTKLIRFPANKKCSSYIIPEGVREIEDRAFANCSSLSSVTIPDGITEIGHMVFAFCSDLTSVIFPKSITSIGSGAFRDCRSLTEITIPDSVLTIEEEAFSGCDGLKYIKLSKGITRIPGNDYDGGFQSYDGCFAFCKNLTEFNIPEGVKEIECRVFHGCHSLTTIRIPSSISKVDKFAFDGCENLNEICVPLGQEERFCQMDGLKKYADIIRLTAERRHHREEDEQRFIEMQQMQATLRGSTMFFDTETTGRPRNSYAPISNSSNWPRLVQLAWIMTDDDGKVLKQRSYIICPEGFTIPSASVEIHHITTERARQEGEPLREVLEEFLSDLEFAERIVGHNVEYDQRIVGAELYRLNMDSNALMDKPSTCTKLSSTDYCALPNPNPDGIGYKWPSLQQLYSKLFGHEFSDAHDALADITATKECFFELKRRGIIQ